MRLYIIRHADPDYANGTITPAGRLEAHALSAALAQEGITRIFSSPLGRAIHTAEYTAERLGLPIAVRQWLEELGGLKVQAGPFADQMAWDVPGHAIRADRAGDDDSLPAVIDEPAFRRELERVRAQSDEFLAELGYVRQGPAYRAQRPNQDRVAVFCHGGLGLTWLAHLLEIPMALMWSAFWLPPSSVTLVLMDERAPGIAAPRCLGLGDTGHLRAAGLPIQPAGIKANYD
jgi:probable phosphoglycerate mutase